MAWVTPNISRMAAMSAYTVREGDTLWGIAERELGGGSQWHRIWRYNNQHKNRIPNPNRLSVGQVLLVPLERGPRTREDLNPPRDLTPALPLPEPSPFRFQPPLPTRSPIRPVPSPGPLTQWPSQTQPFTPPPVPLNPPPKPNPYGGLLSLSIPAALAFKYKADVKVPYDTGTAIVLFGLEGEINIMSEKAFPAVAFTNNGGAELQLVEETKNAFGKLIYDNRVNYDPQKGIVLRSMLLSQAKSWQLEGQPQIGNAPSTGIGFEGGFGTPVPGAAPGALRWELNFKWIQGHVVINGVKYFYFAEQVRFLILITPKLDKPPPPANTGQAEADTARYWRWAIGVTFVVGAIIIVGVMVAQDVGTGGLGAADNPLFLAGAGRLATMGIAMFTTVGTISMDMQVQVER
jgi:hypothetical protein